MKTSSNVDMDIEYDLIFNDSKFLSNLINDSFPFKLLPFFILNSIS